MPSFSNPADGPSRFAPEEIQSLLGVDTCHPFQHAPELIAKLCNNSPLVLGKLKLFEEDESLISKASKFLCCLFIKLKLTKKLLKPLAFFLEVV